jgi:hypothetical protein
MYVQEYTPGGLSVASCHALQLEGHCHDVLFRLLLVYTSDLQQHSCAAPRCGRLCQWNIPDLHPIRGCSVVVVVVYSVLRRYIQQA